MLAAVVTDSVAEGPVEALDISTQAIAKDPALFKEIRQQLIVEAVQARARAILRRNLGPNDGRQMELFEPIPDFPDAPRFIVVGKQYGSPLQFTREQAEWFLMWARHRVKGIADRLKLDRKAIGEFAKMLKQAKPYLVSHPDKTLGGALDDRKKHLSTAASQQRRRAAERAREAKKAKHGRT